ncbi:2-succinyl-5-enolpyruvyl-6-hydroxy-3-cyclohexene-1-carboxylic-acid synthase [Sinomicrobium soli]|uniref:2-succinyl-5-enolpyruvyl-6-hydroxy-3- cyclohexene-1-carboxylic-acid synthase n=1 Tax=Sinomicrobium sp. N-1-3-6 TaxID=2219864 RepID=UPI000DCE6C3A|nr:2-succinyl-5-enolpyruvyl-6-hydroxy-3-cyclohexene-1-carboxylic-acid synthase [Sinomicrobium sp. N-1-3-6]RAV29144.1 2-succinyl-5-enolpyruvyl-6-hydroxy-3-cyclohexene-1-carboxylic-acid synthase [Sinomicrobium sp. N-1-3-6]
MIYPKIPLAQHVLQWCRKNDVREIVISPGSRNAPLTIGFTHDDFFNCYSIVDERCAAFFALGMARQSGRPAALVCTSGSALLNYYPAVCEAYYSDIPLVVISADRPASKIDIGDGQTIRQENVYANHILYSANLREGESAFNTGEIQRALDTAAKEKGPVHINVPFEEPLYDMVEVPVAEVADEHPVPQPEKGAEEGNASGIFAERWNNAGRKMVLVGVNAPAAIPEHLLNRLAEDPSVLVFTETTSNLYHPGFFPGIDKIIAPIEKAEEELEKLRPDMLLTFGGLIVSKKVKAFLRKHPPQWHYHIDPKKAYDTYFCLTHHFRELPADFFNRMFPLLQRGEGTYAGDWKTERDRREQRHETFMQQLPFSDMKVYGTVFRAIPDRQVLHFSNSATIRYSQLFSMKPGWDIYCNRGTSGIDGSMSTAIGASVATAVPTTLVTGDLSFFYDSNALWNRYLKEDFRIVLVNNGGGGIFRILPGHKNTPNFDTYFETVHGLTAEHLCRMYGIDYTAVRDEPGLQEELNRFYGSSGRPKLIEIFTPRTANDVVLVDYFRHLSDS